MPYNFEATFTQPILAELDAGRIGNAQSWANAITRYYINTIKLGIPVGVPPVLPAPGLNPTTPPPFAIGASSFTTADSRKSAMYNIIYAYFRAKELKLQQSSIQATVGSIKQLLRKIKSTKQRIAAITTQLKLLTTQLEQLPDLLQQLDDGVKLFMEDQMSQLDRLVNSIGQGQLGVDIPPDQVNTLFREELLVVEDLKQFSLTNKQGIVRLSTFLAQQNNRTEGSVDNQQVAKVQLQKRLTKLVKEVLSFVQIPIQPSLFVDYANNLERISTKFSNFARAIRQIGFIERFIKPRLAKLKKAIKELTNKLISKLQPKVAALRNTLTAKLKQFNSQANNNKSAGLFKKAQKTIRKLKKLNSKQIAKQTARIKSGRALIKQCTALSTKLVALTTTLEQEIKSTESVLKRQRSQLGELESTSSELQHANTQIELAKLHNYMEGNGFGSFYQVAAKLLTSSRSTAKNLIDLFERQNNKYSAYGKDIVSLSDDIHNIQREINKLFGGKNVRNKSKVKLKIKNKVSIKSLLVVINTWLKSKLSKIQLWLRQFVKQIATKVKAGLQKAQKALINLAANLIPVPSNGRDPKTRLDMQRAKAKAIRERVKKVRETTKKLTSLVKAVPATSTLISNIAGGKFRLSDSQTQINQIVSSIYDFRRQQQSPASQHRLVAEQQRLSSNLNSLLVAESIVNALALIKANIGSQAKAELNHTFDQIKQSSTDVYGDQGKVVDAVREAIENPPKSLNQLRAAGEAVTSPVLTSIKSTSRLVELEKKILRTVRQPIQALLDNPSLKSRYQQATASGNTGGLFVMAYRELQRISVGLAKQQSLILLCLRALSKIITRLFEWIKINIKKLLDRLIKAVKAKLAKIQKSATKELKHRTNKAINLDGALLSSALGLSARAFWLGANWTGPTGSTHTSISVGGFRPRMRARVQDGATGFVREMAQGFQTQLQLMKGLVTPPPNTGIAPLQFTGYK